ncbi:hypothetical protein LRD69_17025 [Streptomyces sp. JH14]|uniref:hypothetical protein n=1 Tax=Streptomyces sp. JH14 TaxID=2793630 RepID=UPI0023F772C6|nr:hypothetical protein [Streptomyces sp. JH14]MDF6043801.1 hypothetical protein [Streptomyces sp. JH14]
MAATTVIAAGGMLATATSASATLDPPGGSWDHTWTTADAGHGGTINVEEYGDILNLCDTDADGKSPVAEIQIFSPSGYYDSDIFLVATGGYSSCDVSAASQGGVHNIPEGYTVKITMYLQPYNYQTDTSKVVHSYLNDH